MKWIKAVIFLSVLICMILFIRATDMQKVLLSVQQIGFRFIYIIIITFLAYWMATIGWHFCLGKEGLGISISRLFLIRHIGETVGAINPTSIVGGEAMKVYLLGNKNIERSTVILSVLISRMLMISTQLLVFFIALGWLLMVDDSIHFSVVYDGKKYLLVLLFIIYDYWLLSKTAFVKKLLLRVKRTHFFHKHFYRFSEKIKEWKTVFIRFFQQQPKAILWSSLYLITHWLLGSLEFYIILHLLGTNTSVIQALLLDMGIILFKAAGAFIPGQLGVEEYGNKIMLSVIGIVDDEIWLTASLLRRTRQLFWIMVGLIAYLLLNKKEKTL